MSPESWITLLTHGRAFMTAILAGLMAGIALVFIRKERRRNSRTNVKIVKIRRAEFIGDSRRGGRNRQMRQSQAAKAFSMADLLSPLLRVAQDFLTKVWNLSKVLKSFAGSPEIQNEDGQHLANIEEASGNAFPELSKPSPKFFENETRIEKNNKKPSRRKAERTLRPDHRPGPRRKQKKKNSRPSENKNEKPSFHPKRIRVKEVNRMPSPKEVNRIPSPSRSTPQTISTPDDFNCRDDKRGCTQIDPSETEKRILESMGWDAEESDATAPLSDDEVKTWKKKWHGWNYAKKATIRKIIGLPAEAKIEDVIMKLIQLEQGM
mmetsp:Transcript_9006/g.13480  ORF Transcript_9006/g.13480 Transcript_9006/m.13480 type:complete len:321 (+) Transcript_9006:41-1003(+)